MPSTDPRAEVAVGLVYQSDELHTHLRDALRDLGAQVVYETETAKFDRSALARAGAQVVVVNLDPDADEQLDAIDDLLVDDQLKVVFNDGEVTSKLSGYDLARWARHLAAKIMGDAELLPPRPVGAEAVPVRSMPQHGLTTAAKPKSLDAPTVSDDSMRDTTAAIADALASFDVHTTKLEAKNTGGGGNGIDDLLGDFGFSEPAPATAAGDENPFADLGLELDFADAAKSPAPAAEVAAAEPNLADDLLAFADLNFDEPPPTPKADVVGLDDLLAAQPRVEKAAAPAPAPVARDVPAPPTPPDTTPRKSLLEGLTLSLEPQGDDVPATPPVQPVAAPAETKAAAFDFDFNLDGLSLEPIDDSSDKPVAAAPTKSASPTAAPKPAPETNLFADLGLSLEPLEGEAPPAPAAAPKATPSVANVASELVAATPEPSPFDGLDFSLDDIPSGGVATGSTTDALVTDDEFSFSLDDDIAVSLDSGSDDGAAEDDFMREFAALTADSSASAAAGIASPAAAGGALNRVWVLGASIGGPDAVREFLAAIPASIGAVFVLAQHMGGDFVELMIGQLQKATPLRVVLADSVSRAATGQVLVVPIAERMLLERDGSVRIVPLDEPSPFTPSIDRVLYDVADRFGAAAGAIIFSGMAHDAIEGAKHMAAKGGTIWVQDPNTCVVSSMIDGAMDAGIVSYIGKPAELAAEFVRRFGKG